MWVVFVNNRKGYDSRFPELYQKQELARGAVEPGRATVGNFVGTGPQFLEQPWCAEQVRDLVLRQMCKGS